MLVSNLDVLFSEQCEEKRIEDSYLINRSRIKMDTLPVKILEPIIIKAADSKDSLRKYALVS